MPVQAGLLRALTQSLMSVVTKSLASILMAATLATVAACEPAVEEYDPANEAKADDQAELYCTEETECTHLPQPTANSCIFYVGFDGSGLYSPDENSSIGKIYKMIPGPKAQGANGLRAGLVSATTTRAYIEGVPGIVFGDSAERVDRGLGAVCQHLDKRTEPCDIVLMGYSRGSVIANHVARALNEDGCPGDGSHKGTEIAFLGSFDPVATSMGWRWEDRAGNAKNWTTTVPSNVKRFQQVFKSQILDPRWGLEAILATSPHNESAVESACTTALGRDEHPDGDLWHHGEIGHFSLPRKTMLCALEQHGISVD